MVVYERYVRELGGTVSSGIEDPRCEITPKCVPFVAVAVPSAFGDTVR
jgi:hypothetical protein